MKEMVT